MFNRFNGNGTTPRTETLNHLLGSSIRYEGVVISKEEKKKLDILYGYEKEVGADRNMLRYAAHDGLRIMAWLARSAETGEDPLKLVIRMAIDQGFDVDPEDVAYADFGDEPMIEHVEEEGVLN